MWLLIMYGIIGAMTAARESYYQGTQQRGVDFSMSKLGPAPALLSFLCWWGYWLAVVPYRRGQIGAEQRAQREIIEAAERSRRRDLLEQLEREGREEANRCLLEGKTLKNYQGAA